MVKGTSTRFSFTWRPSQIKRRLRTALNATPRGRTQTRSPLAHLRIVPAATPAATDSDTKLASANADGWLERCTAAAGPFSFHSSWYPPARMDRVRAQVTPTTFMAAPQ